MSNLFSKMKYKIKKKNKKGDQATIFVAAPHTSFLDAFVFYVLGLPSCVSRADNGKIPLIGRLIKCVSFYFKVLRCRVQGWCTQQIIYFMCWIHFVFRRRRTLSVFVTQELTLFWFGLYKNVDKFHLKKKVVFFAL